MTSPDNLAGIGRHVTDNGRVGLLVREDALNAIQFGGIIVEDRVVLGGELVLQGVALQRLVELVQQFKGIFDVFETVEVVVNEVLQLDVQVRNLHVELDVVAVELVILVV